MNEILLIMAMVILTGVAAGWAVLLLLGWCDLDE